MGVVARHGHVEADPVHSVSQGDYEALLELLAEVIAEVLAEAEINEIDQ
jgi:hypothetical protein